MQAFVEHTGGRALAIATTGMCARELHARLDAPAHFYQIGSMGCAAALGLGVALHRRAPIHVLDGDGALLMRMGAMAMIGPASADLVHIVLDNGVHDSTGGQATGSRALDIPAIALGCGYRRAYACDSARGLHAALAAAAGVRGAQLIHVRTRTARRGPMTPTPRRAC
ncbi:MAG TPA: thiamine pyrophosphate-dependent enzyme [Kofleriaceae bacterium]